jgi:hypothetical protein
MKNENQSIQKGKKATLQEERIKNAVKNTQRNERIKKGGGRKESNAIGGRQKMT